MSKHNLTLIAAAITIFGLAGCSSADYLVVGKATDPATGQPVIIKHVSADAPGGDTFTTVVYYGANVAPTVHAGADSTALVDATAATARSALNLVTQALLKVP